MKFKIGDTVVKARPYIEGDGELHYCKHGGDEYAVPLGTIGKVVEIKDQDISSVRVRFTNGVDWTLDESELDMGVITLRGLIGGKTK